MSYKQKQNDAADLHKALSQKPRSIVLYYAEWCGHCKDFRNTWNELCTKLQSNTHIQALCIESNDITRDMGIQGYPTIKVYENQNFTIYNGSRVLDDILSHLGVCTKCGKTKRKK